MIWIGTFIAKKMNKPPGGGGGIAFLIWIIFIIYMFIGPSRLYVVNGVKKYSHYIVFGSPEYTLADGQIVTVKISSGHCFVINETNRDMVVEEIVYGGIFGGDVDWIYPHTGEEVEGGKIDYFYDDEPPDEISVSSSTDEVTRLWLREARL